MQQNKLTNSEIKIDWKHLNRKSLTAFTHNTKMIEKFFGSMVKNWFFFLCSEISK